MTVSELLEALSKMGAAEKRTLLRQAISGVEAEKELHHGSRHLPS